MLMVYLYIMKSENLYLKIEIAFKERGFRLNENWDKINYTAKMLMCDQLIASGKWMELPEDVIYAEDLVF